MKVQLFVPPGGYFAERWSKGTSMPPLGLLSIGAVLEREGIEVEIIPTDILKLGGREIEKKIVDERPDIVGVTSTTENRFQSFELVRRAKRAFPQALTVMGGPHASMAAEDALAHIPELDIVVRGEGEETTLDLCRALERKREVNGISHVSGISYRLNGHIIVNPPRSPIFNLDSLPFPAFHLVPFEKYNFRIEVPGRGLLPAVNIMTSRGCPFHCNFCATPINWGREVRTRSPRNVVREIESHIRDYGIHVVHFYDDTFNLSRKRMEEMSNLILERKLPIFWQCEIRIDLMTKPLLAKMKEAGLFYVSFGLEAGSERVRNSIINKKVSLKDFENVVSWCGELEIIPNAFFIFSHPTETWEEAKETIKIIEQYKDQIEGSIAILHIYPGTPLKRTARELGLLPKNFSWTKKYFSKIVTLPMAQGDVPHFLDKLSWAQVSELVFRWKLSGQKASVLKKIPRTLTSIHSWGDIKRYAIMAYVYLKLRLKSFFEKRRV